MSCIPSKGAAQDGSPEIPILESLLDLALETDVTSQVVQLIPQVIKLMTRGEFGSIRRVGSDVG